MHNLLISDVVRYLHQKTWGPGTPYKRGIQVFQGPLDLYGSPVEIVLPTDEWAHDRETYIRSALNLLAALDKHTPEEMAEQIRQRLPAQAGSPLARLSVGRRAVVLSIRRSAAISPCGTYRWWLRREWSEGEGVVCFIMLNPSTADAAQDDPTIRRCIGFARAWGYSSLSVRNLFAYRATDPKALLAAGDPRGGARGDRELLAGLTADRVVLAWGASVPFGRESEVLTMFARWRPDVSLWCLGTTQQGKPRHPLYVAATQPLLPWKG